MILRDALADLIEDRPSPDLDRRLSEDAAMVGRFDFTADSARVVLVLREEYLARLERWRKIIPSLLRNRQELRLLDGPRALEAVTGPARIGRAPGHPGLVTNEVGAAIVRAVSNVSEDTPLEDIEAVPPLLSLLCRELNERRLSDAQDVLDPASAVIDLDLVRGSRSEILNRFYTDCFADLPDDVRIILEEDLLSPGGYRESPSYDSLAVRLKQHGIDEHDRVLAILVERRLITAEERNGHRRVELTHDVLAPIVRASRDEREQHEEKLAAEKRALESEQAQKKAEDEKLKAQRSEALLRRRYFHSIVFAACASVLFLVTVYFYSLSTSARKAADNEKNKAIVASDQLNLMRQNALQLAKSQAIGKTGLEAISAWAVAVQIKPDDDEAFVQLLDATLDTPFTLPARLWTGGTVPSFKSMLERKVTVDADQRHFAVISNGVAVIRNTDHLAAEAVTFPIPAEFHSAIFRLGKQGRRLVALQITNKNQTIDAAAPPVGERSQYGDSATTRMWIADYENGNPVPHTRTFDLDLKIRKPVNALGEANVQLSPTGKWLVAANTEIGSFIIDENGQILPPLDLPPIPSDIQQAVFHPTDAMLVVKTPYQRCMLWQPDISDWKWIESPPSSASPSLKAQVAAPQPSVDDNGPSKTGYPPPNSSEQPIPAAQYPSPQQLAQAYYQQHQAYQAYQQQQAVQAYYSQYRAYQAYQQQAVLAYSQQLQTIPSYDTETQQQAQFSPDGEWLIKTSNSQKLRFWNSIDLLNLPASNYELNLTTPFFSSSPGLPSTMAWVFPHRSKDDNNILHRSSVIFGESQSNIPGAWLTQFYSSGSARTLASVLNLEQRFCEVDQTRRWALLSSAVVRDLAGPSKLDYSSTSLGAEDYIRPDYDIATGYFVNREGISYLRQISNIGIVAEFALEPNRRLYPELISLGKGQRTGWLTSNGQCLMVLDEVNNTIHATDIATGQPLPNLQTITLDQNYQPVTICHQRWFVASTSGEILTVRVWDLQTGKAHSPAVSLPDDAVGDLNSKTLGLDSSGDFIYCIFGKSGDDETTLYRWKIAEGTSWEPVKHLPPEEDMDLGQCMAIIKSTGDKPAFSLFNLTTQTKVPLPLSNDLDASSGPHLRFHLSSDHQRLTCVSSHQSGFLNITVCILKNNKWEASPAQTVVDTVGLDQLSAITVSDDGKYLAIHDTAELCVWRLGNNPSYRTPLPKLSWVKTWAKDQFSGMAFIPGSSRLSISTSELIRTVDVKEWDFNTTPEERKAFVEAVTSFHTSNALVKNAELASDFVSPGNEVWNRYGPGNSQSEIKAGSKLAGILAWLLNREKRLPNPFAKQDLRELAQVAGESDKLNILEQILQVAPSDPTVLAKWQDLNRPKTIYPSLIRFDGRYASASASLPMQVTMAINAANHIQGKPYVRGAGHTNIEDRAYDSSSSVSYTLIKAGLLKSPITSAGFAKYGQAGEGRFITVWVKPGEHVFMTVCGLRLDTSGDSASEGPRWRTQSRSYEGFTPRHPFGF
ncbi:hypothetical protein HNQ64_001550 [Prosthecobacter dejongeii]|uniref:WD40 repeat n=1 Tax=Prosthecobacter dejongeii TaxID=48465 RepID=A0A7W8DPD3_9BACT|nr:WD40 repeat domain-containing protein [Prosthecobacter dejongeii]MBB5037308.1 hypothetical protein [Prosthecobacter dejongeii]